MTFFSGDMTEIVTYGPEGDIKVNMYVVIILVDVLIRRPEGDTKINKCVGIQFRGF